MSQVNQWFARYLAGSEDFTDVPLRDDQREYLCKVADG